ncbi:DUF262 domain-containing protein [Corynebacterium macginleyi]|uniref:DUF262 domain-containing protein n=1 Tax=Corynebacterium macginleyi TaxID=38290 RepID=A0A3M0G7B8_9CORY|nr:DUF262 domain-containing protein [Corynebacterium macginleyi]MBK4156147.1 DUF262 domain-containing protein [Corynebacterium macginleyi]RMB60814.1 DUF262 domain-containing protein [Corynebacterium macginleyi]
MRGSIREIYTLYDGNNRRLLIPVYQRNYDWQHKQCARLFDDLEEIILSDRKKHFFGAVVGKNQDSWNWIVIDGQQRLTTVSILMLAFAHALRDDEIQSEDPSLAEKIISDYLRIGYNKENPRFKLKPVKDDDNAYQRLFGPETEFINSSNVTSNYRFFREKLRSTSLDADQVWKAICRLEVMHLDLEEYDEPQRIFESLNSTGLELKEADKIRNYVLMGLDSTQQERLYNERWNPIEDNCSFQTDSFIRWYLTTYTTKTPREQDVYEAFKSFASKRKTNMPELLDDLYAYSKYFREIRESDTGYPEVDTQLKRMNEFMGAVVLPFLMPLLRDVHESKTTPDDFLEVLLTIESYIVRRFVTGIATNSLNKIFATMYAEISKLHADGTPFAPIVIYQLNRRSGSGRFPTDAEFKEAFATKDFYNIRAYWRQYLFNCLENGDSKDIRDVSTALAENRISIEHIMPQTLTDAWRQELGDKAEEIHESWLNRIGNLTVTGYNSSYSNSPFTTKKTMENGFDSSPYRLNELLKQFNRWSLTQLEERNELLTNKALAFWEAKPTNFAPPEAVLPKEPMGESEEFSGRKISGFEFGDFRKTTKSWADMVEAVLKYLLHEHRTEILSFAESSKFLRSENPAVEQDRSFRKIEEGLYVQVGNNTSAKIWFLRSLFEYLDLDPEDLVFTFPVSKTGRTDDTEGQESSDTSGKYAELTKFYDQLVEAQELRDAPKNTELLRSEFIKDFENFSVTDPQALFGGKELTEFISSTEISEMSDDQVLAVLTQHIKVSQMLGGSYLHKEIINGSIAKLVHRLSEFS